MLRGKWVAMLYIHLVDCKGQRVWGFNSVVKGPPLSCGLHLSLKVIYECVWFCGLVNVFIALTTLFSSSIGACWCVDAKMVWLVMQEFARMI